MSAEYCAMGVRGLPEFDRGDNIARALVASFDFNGGDVLVVAQKVISKIEGRTVALDSVQPSPAAQDLAARSGKSAGLCQLILDESRQVLRVREGTIIVEDRRGWVCANAGIDRSNVNQTGESEILCLLPLDPDASALALQQELAELTGFDVGVIISDSHGRAWREGTVGVCIGASGLVTVTDRRGQPDRHGYVLQHTTIGTADELAAAASLLMGQGNEGLPCVVLRGISVLGQGDAKSLQRPRERDLFR